MVGALFLRPGRPRNGGSGAGHITAPEPGKPCISRLTRQEGRSTRPGSRSSRPKRAGFTAHGEIIADELQKSKGAGRANRALKRAEINTHPGKGLFWALHHWGSRRAEPLQAVTWAVQPGATPCPGVPKSPQSKGTFSQKCRHLVPLVAPQQFPAF